MRCFCTEGTCFPEIHYMVDVSGKAMEIISLIKQGEYFCMNRPRQYGKTSMLRKLDKMLSPECYVIRISFQGIGRESFTGGEVFVSSFMGLVSDCMKQKKFPRKVISAWNGRATGIADALHRTGRKLAGLAPDTPFCVLRERIIRLCSTADKPVVLLIDEVDLVSCYPVFLDFLGMLRASYLHSKREAAFQSVIFAGLADIRNLKGKVRTVEEYNAHSPWNIADDFDVDMSFSAEEIAGMLREYEADHQTGMDITKVSLELCCLTSGYPYIVSWICNWLDTKGGRNWTSEGVRAAGRAFTQSDCTLLRELWWNINDDPELKEVLMNILYCGADYTFKPFRPTIELGATYGYLKDDGANCAMISNLLFEEYIYEYTVEIMRNSVLQRWGENRNDFVQGFQLNMIRILNRFQEVLASTYDEEGGGFIRQNWSLLFLCFLKSIILRTGFFRVEPRTRSGSRMDVVIFHEDEEYIVELRVWYDPESRKNGIHEMEEYMDSRKARSGYLVSFNILKADGSDRGWLSSEEISKQIYEVFIPCADKR